MIKTVVIVGGGTSGWLTALAVTHRIPNVGVILIDKEESTAVGVGELHCWGLINFLMNIVVSIHKNGCLL